MIRRQHRIPIILSLIGLILLVPLIAMQFTEEVQWTVFDFLVMGGLLLATGLGVELVLRTVVKFRNRFLLCAAVLVLFLLTWAELAVGIFGTVLAGR